MAPGQVVTRVSRILAPSADLSAYAEFVAEHPEWDDRPFRSLAAPEYGTYDSLADVLRQIGDDEGCTSGSASTA
jgi:hypothetical protein